MENNKKLPITNSRYPLPQQVAGLGWNFTQSGKLAISQAIWVFYSGNQLKLKEDKTKTEEIGWKIHITAELQADEKLGTFHVTFENPAIQSEKNDKQKEKLRFGYTLEPNKYGKFVKFDHDE